MTRTWLALVVCLVCAGENLTRQAAAEESAVTVFCPAVAFDDQSSRGRSLPSGPGTVVLMIVGKAINQPKEEFKKREPQPIEIQVERVLFGSPPGDKIILQPGRFTSFTPQLSDKSEIYGITVTLDRKDQLAYSADDYFLWDRTYPLSKLAKAEALARARLDLQVMSQYAIFVGQPSAAARELTQIGESEAGGEPKTAEVTVERVLHGPLKVAERIAVTGARVPIPLSGKGPFLYFVGEARKTKAGGLNHYIDTRWSLEAIDAVTAALARRGDYPIREVTDDGGEKSLQQEITFRGSREQALELLQEDGNPVEILGVRRLLADGEAAIPAVVALIEKHLWQPKIEGQGDFQWQHNLIQMLVRLKNERTDGEVARLIQEVLTRAEAGATFPHKVTERAENDGLPRSFQYGHFNVASNHSLGWLLLTMRERDAAKLYGERLIKLRDLAAYGWKDEAQTALDALHIDDHLALAKVEPRSKQAKTVEWRGGFRGDDLSGYELAFTRDGRFVAAVSDSTARVWSTADWSIVSEFAVSGSIQTAQFTPDGISLILSSGHIGVSRLQRWNWSDGKVAQEYQGSVSAARCNLSRDGEWLLVLDIYEDSLSLLNAKTGATVWRRPDENWTGVQVQPEGNSSSCATNVFEGNNGC